MPLQKIKNQIESLKAHLNTAVDTMQTSIEVSRTRITTALAELDEVLTSLSACPLAGPSLEDRIITYLEESMSDTGWTYRSTGAIAHALGVSGDQIRRTCLLSDDIVRSSGVKEYWRLV